MFSLLSRQPRPFFMIFMLEIWERFGFYSVQGILVLFFIRHLGFSKPMAYEVFGAFSALIYSMIPIGGFLGDKILGTSRTIILGLVVLAAGYFVLAWSGDSGVFFALGLICIGNGLFKANPAALLARCYQDNSATIHVGFTMYYMAINLGAILALFVGPVIASHYGYPYAYTMSAGGILFGLLNCRLQRQTIMDLKTAIDQRKMTWLQWGAMGSGIVLVAWFASYVLQHVLFAKGLISFSALMLVIIYLFCLFQEPIAARRRMLLALLLMVEAVAFFTLYQQMPTSINLFAVQHVRPIFWGITIDPQSFQGLNPIGIVFMSPVFAAFYAFLQRRQIMFPIAYKFALGMTCCALSFVMLFLSRFFSDSQGMVSPGWMVGSYWFQSMGELLVSALGVAMVAELVPKKITGFVMGMWYLTSSLAGLTGAKVASYTATTFSSSDASNMASLFHYTQVFATIGLITCFVALLLWMIAPLLTRLMCTNRNE